MAKIRIYELARELGLENKVLLDLCEQVEVFDKTSHSNSLSDDEAERLRRAVIRRAMSGKVVEAREIERAGGTFTERRLKGNVIRRRKKSGEQEDVPKSAIEEAEEAEGTLVDFSRANVSLSTVSEVVDVQAKALSDADALFEEITPVAVADIVAEECSDEVEAEQVEVSQVIEPSEVEEVLPESDIEAEPLAKSLEESVIAKVEASDVEQKNEDSEVLETQEQETGEETQNIKLADIRRRHDIRAPKVLGKIELPVDKKVVSVKTKDAKTGARESKEAREPAKGKVFKSATKDKTKGTFEDESGAKKVRSQRKRKQVLRKDDLLDYDRDREGWRQRRGKKAKRGKDAEARVTEQAQEVGPTKASKKIVKVAGEISVGELSKTMGLKAAEVIKQLMSLGIMANINQLIDFDTATLVATEFEFTTQNVADDNEDFLAEVTKDPDEVVLELRSPVVTVMGHVDHGKTSLLDAIRDTSVTDSEAGGITQHIGAYTVTAPSGGFVTFIDTPGHAAFTEMRSRGAKVTDIVVLVVAADDGVMPQTIEAISHAKAAEVPIIVAVNKMDKADANPDRVKQQLSDHGLISEEWGGDTIMVPVSAHTKDGIDSLLENLALQAEILELKATPNRSAVGTVIESRVERGRGPVMTVLIQKGTLKKGDVFIAGTESGKVRAMTNHDGNLVDEAGPSVPVEVIGVSGAPGAGEDFVVLSNESDARRYAEQRSHRQRARELVAKGGVSFCQPLTLESFADMAAVSEVKELPLIVKADVQGSVEAVSQALLQLSNEEVAVKIIHKGVGAVSENDVQLASASNAIIIAFNVRADVRAIEHIEVEGIDVRYSRVIYELVEVVERAVLGLKKPVFREKVLGRVEVRDTFKVPKLGVIAGSYVLDGVVQRGSSLRLLRDNRVVFEGKMASLRRFKDDVKEVAAGYECGVGIEGYNDIKNGDVIEVYTMEEVRV